MTACNAGPPMDQISRLFLAFRPLEFHWLESGLRVSQPHPLSNESHVAVDKLQRHAELEVIGAPALSFKNEC